MDPKRNAQTSDCAASELGLEREAAPQALGHGSGQKDAESRAAAGGLGREKRLAQAIEMDCR